MSFIHLPNLLFITVAALVLFLVVFFGVGMPFVCNFAGFIPPAVLSISALEGGGSLSDRTFHKTQWMTYWVVFAIFVTLETFISVIIYFVPYYYAFKVRLYVYQFFYFLFYFPLSRWQFLSGVWLQAGEGLHLFTNTWLLTCLSSSPEALRIAVKTRSYLSI